MKFVVGANNLKIFAKSIIALSKVGDEIYVEPLQNSLTLRTVNSSRSAFGYFAFKQSFFTYFEPELFSRKNVLNTTTAINTSINASTSKRANQTNIEEDSLIEETEVFKCKIPSKCLLSIFKNINSLEKNVERCTITVKYIPLNFDATAYDYDSTMKSKKINKNNTEQLYDIKFLIIMSCKHSLRKTFILSISDCENLQAAFSHQNCTNKLQISAKYLNETINCFNDKTEEVSIVIEENKLYIKNFFESDSTDKSLINTQVGFDSDEFNIYEIEKETDITFCLKEFKIFLQFGFYFDLALDIYFKKKGRPIVFNYSSNNSYEANFTLATLAEDFLTTQNSTISTSNTSVYSRNQTSKLVENVKKNIPIQNKKVFNDSIIKNLVEKEKPLQISKGNKRTLFDASNHQANLNDSIDLNASKNNLNKQQQQGEDSAEEDALLTQALNEQESRDTIYNNSKISPPAKKMKSLVQTLFDDKEEETQDISSKIKEANKKKAISFANLIEIDEDEEERETEKKNNQHNSIYIEETSSEEDDDD